MLGFLLFEIGYGNHQNIYEGDSVAFSSENQKINRCKSLYFMVWQKMN